jgi:hypothetical protein
MEQLERQAMTAQLVKQVLQVHPEMTHLFLVQQVKQVLLDLMEQQALVVLMAQQVQVALMEQQALLAVTDWMEQLDQPDQTEPLARQVPLVHLIIHYTLT